MDGFFKKLNYYLFSLKNIFKKTSDVQSHKKALGKKGEVVAAKFLKKKGYKILQRNYRRKTGEIDIICYERGSIVFVEVKTRGSDSYGPPELAVTEAKKKQIIKFRFTFSLRKIKDKIVTQIKSVL